MRSICRVIMVTAVCWLFGLAAAAQPASEAESFNYFANDWNVVGLKDYRHGSRVTPQNELLLGGEDGDSGAAGPRACTFEPGNP